MKKLKEKFDYEKHTGFSKPNWNENIKQKKDDGKSANH